MSRIGPIATCCSYPMSKSNFKDNICVTLPTPSKTGTATADI